MPLGRGGISSATGVVLLETEFAGDFMESGCRLEGGEFIRNFGKASRDKSHWSLNHLATFTEGSPAARSKAWDPKATAVESR